MSRRAKLEAMLQADPTDSFIHYALAMDYLNAGEHEAARTRLVALAQSDPHYVPTYFQLGRVLQMLDELAECRDWLERGIQVAHTSGDAHAAGEMRGLLESLG